MKNKITFSLKRQGSRASAENRIPVVLSMVALCSVVGSLLVILLAWITTAFIVKSWLDANVFVPIRQA